MTLAYYISLQGRVMFFFLSHMNSWGVRRSNETPCCQRGLALFHMVTFIFIFNKNRISFNISADLGCDSWHWKTFEPAVGFCTFSVTSFQNMMIKVWSLQRWFVSLDSSPRLLSHFLEVLRIMNFKDGLNKCVDFTYTLTWHHTAPVRVIVTCLTWYMSFLILTHLWKKNI